METINFRVGMYGKIEKRTFAGKEEAAKWLSGYRTTPSFSVEDDEKEEKYREIYSLINQIKSQQYCIWCHERMTPGHNCTGI